MAYYKNTDDTIRSVSLYGRTEKKFRFAFSNFLDSFYRASQEERIIMISEEPAEMQDRVHLAILAAAANRLANLHGVPVPSWVYKGMYFLDESEPYYDNVNHAEYREWLRRTTPLEFSSRHLFLGADVLSRA